jgi:hypothetical protein
MKLVIKSIVYMGFLYCLWTNIPQVTLFFDRAPYHTTLDDNVPKAMTPGQLEKILAKKQNLQHLFQNSH